MQAFFCIKYFTSIGYNRKFLKPGGAVRYLIYERWVKDEKRRVLFGL